MRRVWVVFLALAACQDPPKTAQHDTAVRGLIDLKSWDASTGAAGQYAYDAVLRSGPEILPVLVAHLTDETVAPLLYDRVFDIQVNLGDICFAVLLKLTGMKSEEFLADGVFMSTQLPNPIFCIRWKDGAASRKKVQAHFTRLLPKPEDDN